jgi:hypothetical protein
VLLCAACVTSAGKAGPPAGEAEGATAGQQEQTEKSAAAGESRESAERAKKESAAGGVQAEKPEPEQPQELRRAEFWALVREKLPERFVLLRQPGGEPVSVFHDLDDNGYEDGFFLLLDREEVRKLLGLDDDQEESAGQSESQTAERAAAGDAEDESGGEGERSASTETKRKELPPVTTAMMGDMSTLLSEEKPAAGYYLGVYLQRADGIISMYRLPLGSWKVFDDFSSLSIKEGSDMPYGLTATFQTQEGTEHQWVIFYRYDKFSIFTFSDTIATRYEVADIDDDGLLDVVEWHKVFEEGTGYETYVTWYRWSGTGYTRHDTTNVVRNLNRFLERISRLLEQGEWEQLLATALREPDLRRLQEVDGWTARMELLFRGDDQLPASAELQRVIFPSVFENPFSDGSDTTKQQGKLNTVRFSARFVYRSGASQVRQCEVGISENPFNGREFFILPE